MKLQISQVREGENPFQFDSSRDGWIREVIHHIERQGYELQGPLHVDMNLTKLEPDYYLRGQMGFSVTQTCARCTESFPYPVQHSFTVALAHVSKPRINGAELANEESEELDVNFFDGTEIDLAPIIQEQFFLSIPYQSLCRADCKGMCQRCGQNLNVAECCCPSQNTLNPFSVLKDFKAK